MEKGSRRSFLRVLWADFPLVNFALYAVLIAHAEVANLIPPRPDLFISFLFPLSVPVLIYALRWRSASGTERAVALTVILGALALLAMTWFSGTRTPLEPERLRNLYEVSAIVNTMILLLHARVHGGRDMLMFFIGPAAAYGVLLENGGIILGYFSELHYRWYLGPLPAPLATMSGWVTVYYLVIWIAWTVRDLVPAVRRSVALSALTAMVAALLFDLQVDPLATAVGFWRWNEALPTGPMNVPLLNFVAWGAAVLPFAWALFARQNAFGLSPVEVSAPVHRRWMWPRIFVVLAVAAVLFFGAMAIVDGGFDGPTYGILTATLVKWGVVPPDLVWTPGS
ncbi:MAG: carotenoid biosynthesis protein [Myxococcota bacterium]